MWRAKFTVFIFYDLLGSACAGSNPAVSVILLHFGRFFFFGKSTQPKPVAVSLHNTRGRTQPERPRALRPPPSCASCFLLYYAFNSTEHAGRFANIPSRRTALRRRRTGDGGGESTAACTPRHRGWRPR